MRPADAWPASAVWRDATTGRLLLYIAHMAADTAMDAFGAGALMLEALCVFWAVVTEVLPSMNTATFMQRDGNHHLASYRAAMTNLVIHLARNGADLQQEAAVHVAPFGDYLRSVSSDAFLQILAGDDDPKQPVHHVPLIHWLRGWHARHRNSVLPCQIVSIDTYNVLLAPCLLSAQQWNAELNKHHAAVTFPGALSRISLCLAEPADPGSSSTEPLSKEILLHNDTAHSSNLTVDIERL